MKLPSQDAAAREVPEDRSHRVLLPRRAPKPPLRQVARRLLMALFVLLATVFIVWIDRNEYHDNADGKVDLLDCFYYATVTLSTTGYGDIVPYGDSARLLNILLITPLRVLFLIILVGTTLEVLTERTREQWQLKRWRNALRDHTVIVGFGTKGRSAAQTLCATGLHRDRIVIVDPSSKVIDAAVADGFAGVVGDATRSDVLLRAEVQRAHQVVIATQRDDTAVLVSLTARQLNKRANIVAAVREEENAPLLRQSGANSVITSASAAGRLLGLSVHSPSAGTVMEDLIQQGSGLDLVERTVVKAEVGKSVRETDDLVVSVLRGHRLLGYDDPEASPLQSTDRLITIVRAAPAEAADHSGKPSAKPTLPGTGVAPMRRVDE
ncbi:potassium channel family protein [Streptomyces platensis]|uniref:NAD-binding protein of Kef-type K+ transporter n=1 Tax=Streptomyces glebosus TaxID=249580 RepID=A0A640T167_9ACTN|nr:MULTISPECIES: potassium channel family protein [Streptomyces]WTI53294.1 potassium channel family protein [Streptomyces platensis]WUB81083.1 potassium channel family protein [Streptomyces platensis]GFE15385.1 NAD-binding protein of Kef-type K+ transporter [Streptomyces glebosus]GHG50589.1 NAD-binding protein of Kef-type K+ transporter [Streptomyces glebosus]